MVSRTAKRIRRTPEAARRAILEAADRSLIKDGPMGVRVQHIAADLGITGAALHYHFGSREALIDSVMRFSAKRLLMDIDAILEAWEVDQLDIRRLGARPRAATDFRHPVRGRTSEQRPRRDAGRWRRAVAEHFC